MYLNKFEILDEVNLSICSMSDYLEEKDIEKLIEKKHAKYPDGINSRYLVPLNVKEGSIVLDPNTLKYDDYETDENIYYEVPFVRGDHSNRYNEKYAWAFILNNENNKIKFIRVGISPKLEIVTLFPNIVEWKGRKCIKLNKSCQSYKKTYSSRSYGYEYEYEYEYGYECSECGKSIKGDFEQCYECKYY